jgi:L-threonylcarbamoyladenylate synthase
MVVIRSAECDPDVIDDAIDVLSSGGLVIIPTDTVYGVAASPLRPDGVARLYMAKGRPLDRAIPVLVSSFEGATHLVRDVDPVSRKLMERFWPGPLTIVLPAQSWLPEEIVRDTGSVGLRMPDHRVALELISRCGGALATTSANRSNMPETTTASSAAGELGETVDLVIDGGATPGGIASTVVRVTDGQIEILRQGALSSAELEDAVHSR